MDGFSESEKNELITMAKKREEDGKSLSEIFREFALKHERAAGSVRNYYYMLLAESKKNKKLSEKLDIPERLMPAFIEEFSKEESKNMLTEILLGVSKGKSVRKAIVDMANGNDKLMLRYQNKYRNMIKSEKSLVLETVEEITEKYGACYNPYAEMIMREDLKISRLQYEINGMIEKITLPYKNENEKLRQRIAKMERENEGLRHILKQNIKDKSFTKEYFEKIKLGGEAK